MIGITRHRHVRDQRLGQECRLRSIGAAPGTAPRCPGRPARQVSAVWSRSPETAPGSTSNRSQMSSPITVIGDRQGRHAVSPGSRMNLDARRVDRLVRGSHAVWPRWPCAVRDPASPPPPRLWRSPARGLRDPVAIVLPADVPAWHQVAFASALAADGVAVVVLRLQHVPLGD